MFKKPVSNIKSFSALKSSDRRRFRNEILASYPQLKDRIEDTSLLVPDSLQSAKFVSHVDDVGHVYTADGNPLWLVLSDLKPIPTVYSLWRYCDILPILYTWAPVVLKLTEGADLMIPGLVPGPDGTLPSLLPGDLVAITIKGYMYPLAVGTMAMATSEIQPRSGMKGKAVHIIHVYKDYLWAMGNKQHPPNTDGDLNDQEDEDASEDDTEGKDNENYNGKEVDLEGQTANAHASADSVTPTKVTLSTDEVDEILKKSLCYALIHKIKSDAASLPLSASSLYASYILPSRPRETPDVDVKQSSWKKVQKFIKTMEKAGLLKTKEQRGELMVTKVEWSHPMLQGFESYKPIQKDVGAQPTSVSFSADTVSPASVISEAKINALYKPLGNSVVAFFEAAKQDKEELYSAAQVRQIVLDYIKENGHLVKPTNQKQIILDVFLSNAVLKKSESNTIEELPRDSIIQRMLENMQHYHEITFSGKEPVLRKGQPKPVEITQEIRQGRKTVTKVTGMEYYDVQVEELCKELTRLCASSATHNPIHGTSPKNPMHEIMVQGPQIKHVSLALMSKGVPKRLINAVDKTSKKGKK